MGFVPLMWALWGAAILFMAVVSIYSSRLGKNEEDQIFLSDSSSHARSEQDAIAERVEKIQPVKRTAAGACGSHDDRWFWRYYVIDMVQQFK